LEIILLKLKQLVVLIRAEWVHTPPLGAKKEYAPMSAILREKQHTPLLAAGLLIGASALLSSCVTSAVPPSVPRTIPSDIAGVAHAGNPV
jgi:hypothetical protein